MREPLQNAWEKGGTWLRACAHTKPPPKSLLRLPGLLSQMTTGLMLPARITAGAICTNYCLSVLFRLPVMSADQTWAGTIRTAVRRDISGLVNALSFHCASPAAVGQVQAFALLGSGGLLSIRITQRGQIGRRLLPRAGLRQLAGIGRQHQRRARAATCGSRLACSMAVELTPSQSNSLPVEPRDHPNSHPARSVAASAATRSKVHDAVWAVPSSSSFPEIQRAALAEVSVLPINSR